MKTLAILFLFASLTTYAGEGGGAGGGVVPSMQAFVNGSNELRGILEARLLNDGTLEITDGIEILEVYRDELKDVEFQLEQSIILDGVELRDYLDNSNSPSIKFSDFVMN